MSKKILSVFAAATAAALALSACGGNDNKVKVESVKTEGGTVAFSVGAEEYGGYNTELSNLYSTGNTTISGLYSTGFGFYNPDGSWHKGSDMGDYEVKSKNPLTVEYHINPKAKYEGGTPITCEDFYLEWVAQNPQWIQDEQKKHKQLDEQGNPTPLFDNVSGPETYALAVPEGPQCKAGDKDFTVTYSAPNPDWELVVSGAWPSDVVAKKIGMTKEDLFKALKAKNYDVAKKAADFWNNWYSKTPGQLPPKDERPSWGPYRIKEGGWSPGQYVTLERNPDWWGAKGESDQLIVRMVAADAALQALKAKDLNVIEPQATQDTLNTLKSYGDAVKILQGPTQIWEHLDFNFRDGSVFGGADQAKTLKLRQAFALCVPRQDIVDKLIKPLFPDATVLNLREYFQTNENYDDVVAAAYDGSYDKVDIDKAKSLLKEAGVTTPVKVRIGYQSPNPRRADEVSLIKASCDKAGFNIVDGNSGEFFRKVMPAGDYDVALFAWSGSGQVISGENIYATGAPQNFGGYSNKTVDKEWAKVRTSLDPKVWLESKKVIEKNLWDDLNNIPLFTHPGLAAHTTGLGNVVRNVSQSGITWNADKWGWVDKDKVK